mmetsp:Transcript_12272/g.28672  ORF Transcript_12272/g.28672 Transcript_12272/m.28672 type:complete len:560 (-) Transcript_12272:168-1847(-)
MFQTEALRRSARPPAEASSTDSGLSPSAQSDSVDNNNNSSSSNFNFSLQFSGAKAAAAQRGKPAPSPLQCTVPLLSQTAGAAAVAAMAATAGAGLASEDGMSVSCDLDSVDGRQADAGCDAAKLGAESMETAGLQLHQALETAKRLEDLEQNMKAAHLKLCYEMVASQDECRRARDLAGRLEKTERSLQNVHTELESDIAASKEERRAAEAAAEALRGLVQELRMMQTDARLGGLPGSRGANYRSVLGRDVGCCSGMTTPDIRTTTPELQPRLCGDASPMISMRGGASPKALSSLPGSPPQQSRGPGLYEQRSAELLLGGISTAPDLSRPSERVRSKTPSLASASELPDMSSVRRSFEVSQARLRQISANMDKLSELEVLTQKQGAAQAKSQQDVDTLQSDLGVLRSSMTAMQKEMEALTKKVSQVKALAAGDRSPSSRGRHTDAWNARWAAENVRWSTEMKRVTREWECRMLQASQDLGQCVANSEDRLRDEFQAQVEDFRSVLDSSCRCLREEFARMSLQQETRHLEHARALQDTAEGFDILLQKLRQEVSEASRHG